MSNKSALKAKRAAAREAREAQEGRKAVRFVAGILILFLVLGLLYYYYLMA